MIRKFDTAYFMISVDTPEDNKAFAEKEHADFPMLSNPDKKVAFAYGVIGPDAPPDVRVTAHAVASAYDLAPSVAAGRLREAVVGVVGSSALGSEIARLLRLAGVGEVRRVRWLRPGKNDIVVVAPAA